MANNILIKSEGLIEMTAIDYFRQKVYFFNIDKESFDVPLFSCYRQLKQENRSLVEKWNQELLYEQKVSLKRSLCERGIQLKYFDCHYYSKKCAIPLFLQPKIAIDYPSLKYNRASSI